MKSKVVVIILILPVMVLAQSYQQEIDFIPVTINGKQLKTPWNGGFNSLSISMADIDADGDYDLLLSGRDDGSLHFYRNDGNGASGDFVLVNTSISNLEFGQRDNRIAFEDIDFDGDLDLFVGENDGRIKYFRNDGNASQPDFMLVTTFFDSIDVGFVSAPTFGDLNDDGLNDLLIGTYREGIFYYTRNDSSTTEFTFVDTLRSETGQIHKPGIQFFVPSLADIDADGDLDLFASSNESHLAFFRNTGSDSVPQFTLENINFLIPPRYLAFMTPAFVDIDDDLDFDLFFGSNHGFVTFYRNDGTATTPNFVLVAEQIPLDYLDFGFSSAPTVVDIDDDGDNDLFVSTDEGEFHFFRNSGDSSNPQFEWITNQFKPNSKGSLNSPTWGDLDADGDFDLLLRLPSGQILHYRNNGTASEAVLDSIGILKDTLGIEIKGKQPGLADLDGDGDLDLLLSVTVQPNQLDVIMIYENFGDSDSAAFAARPDTLRDQNDELITASGMHFQLADLNRDGSLDIFIGTSGGSIWYYENVGSPTNPLFNFVTGLFAGVDTGNSAWALPFLADVDGDNDLDLFVGRLRTNGVHLPGVDPTWTMTTQWILDEDAQMFYFEVIVGEEE